MKLSDEQIECFLQDRCESEKVEFLYNYLQAHPELLEKYAGKKEWDQLTLEGTIPEEEKEGMWMVIANATSSRSYTRSWRKLVVAATTLLFFVASFKWYDKYSKGPVKHSAEQMTKAEPQYHQKLIENTSGHLLQILLADGTSVRLEKKSTLSYTEPFQNNRRDVELKGKAFFKVAKDKTKPFCVRTGLITTTALGTSFWVNSERKANIVDVELLTGRVVIKKDGLLGNALFKPVFLFPGQQLKVDVLTNRCLVRRIDRKYLQTVSENNKNRSQKAFNSSIDFNNTSLQEVFHVLEQRFSVAIAYNISDIATNTFSGHYSMREKIEDILGTIILLNDLKIEKTNSGYRVLK